ncbi:Hypothetical predicted protein [Podarcis lilfordi]|uniref:Uncharacterized protein n=1 Tax=Podarcis lilfordi TaxID=74358 RepID=A0AA35PJB9_9SAUR|nr:Hypothetical predicted protein [Podarcis lilfordi]
MVSISVLIAKHLCFNLCIPLWDTGGAGENKLGRTQGLSCKFHPGSSSKVNRERGRTSGPGVRTMKKRARK